MYTSLFERCPEGLNERIRMRRLAMQMSRQLREDARMLSRNGGDTYRISILCARAVSIEDSSNNLFVPYPSKNFSLYPFSDN